MKKIFFFVLLISIFLLKAEDCPKECLKKVKDEVRNYVIILDPGHGGVDPGTLSIPISESIHTRCFTSLLLETMRARASRYIFPSEFSWTLLNSGKPAILR